MTVGQYQATIDGINRALRDAESLLSRDLPRPPTATTAEINAANTAISNAIRTAALTSNDIEASANARAQRERAAALSTLVGALKTARDAITTFQGRRDAFQKSGLLT